MGPSYVVLAFGALVLLGTSHLTAAQDLSAKARVHTPTTSFDNLESNLLSVINSSVPALLKGIFGNYSRTASASPFIIWSPSGFPVALGVSNDYPLPVVVAVELSSTSKLVAFGHESIADTCCSNNDDWDKLTLNSIQWMAGGKTTLRMATPTGEWAENALPNVKHALRNLTVTTALMDLDTFAAGGSDQVDIYWIDTYTEYTAAHVTALLKFASQAGKGLLVAGHAWNWGYSHPNANIFTDLAINKVLWPLGLAVTPDAQDGFQPAPPTPPSTWVYHNTYFVASLLAAVKAGAATFRNTTLYPAASTSLNALLKALPSRANSSASGLTELWTTLEAARGGNSSTAGVLGPNSPLNSKTGYPGDILDVAIEVWAIRRGELTGLKASRSASTYPGAPPAKASKLSVTVTINGTYNQPSYPLWYAGWDQPVWRSTGVYAPPGQLITVTLKALGGAINKGLQVQIGAHTDDLTDKDQWFRVPYAYSRFPLNAIATTAGNPLGGLVYILVPPGSSLGNVAVTISNTVRSPYFKLNSTKPADWISTIRNYPGPWAELDSGKFVIMLPSTAVRNLTNPTPLLNHWNLVMDSMAYLANMPTDRARAERFLVDADIGGGWMHSGYPIMAYDLPEVHREMTDLSRLQTVGAWGPYHELGHNHQWGDMQFSGTTESFNNLWTIYALEKTGIPPAAWENWGNVSPEGRAAHRADYFNMGANWDRDWSVWVALDTYLQLKDAFGWEFYRKMYAVYQRMPRPLPADNVQVWIQTSSQVAGVNLVPFYTKWGFPVTQDTRNAVVSLPVWTANPFNKQ